jgi:hypothetical protein
MGNFPGLLAGEAPHGLNVCIWVKDTGKMFPMQDENSCRWKSRIAENGESLLNTLDCARLACVFAPQKTMSQGLKAK